MCVLPTSDSRQLATYNRQQPTISFVKDNRRATGQQWLPKTYCFLSDVVVVVTVVVVVVVAATASSNKCCHNMCLCNIFQQELATLAAAFFYMYMLLFISC